MDACNCIQIPDCNCCIKPGLNVKLGRFQPVYWIVGYGWYSWGGNRPICGWYLIRCTDNIIKPLQRTDLDDIYVVEDG